ncbi:hypothetical protein D3C81_1715320 [compost metagenome]
MLADPLLRQLRYRLSVDRDRAFLRVIKPEEQVDDRAFAGARVTDQRNGLTLLRLEGDIFQHIVLLVGERDILKLHISFVARHRTINDIFARFVHQGKHPSGGYHRGIEGGELIDHPGNRLKQSA